VAYFEFRFIELKLLTGYDALNTIHSGSRTHVNASADDKRPINDIWLCAFSGSDSSQALRHKERFLNIVCDANEGEFCFDHFECPRPPHLTLDCLKGS